MAGECVCVCVCVYIYIYNFLFVFYFYNILTLSPSTTLWVIILLTVIKPEQKLMFIKCGYGFQDAFASRYTQGMMILKRHSHLLRARSVWHVPMETRTFLAEFRPPGRNSDCDWSSKSVTGEFWMFIGSLRCLSICEQDVYKRVKREREAAERAFRIDEKECSAEISVFMWLWSKRLQLGEDEICVNSHQITRHGWNEALSV